MGKGFQIAALWILAVCGASFSLFAQSPAMKNTPSSAPFTVAIHGGAGNLQKLNLSPEQQAAYKAVLDSALQVGYSLLVKGDSAVDVVQQVIMVLENSPLFNAGKGAVFTHEGTNEMDAAIMDGKTLDAGAVAGVTTIKNPIAAARAVLGDNRFVMLSGRGAEAYAAEQHLEIVDPAYFYDEKRWHQMLKLRDSTVTELDHGSIEEAQDAAKYGTVGCVVLDQHGNLAAGTSTGGLANKQFGRIGDSPIIGAGTYANNKTCAISCTGKGEDFIRLTVAHDISAMMEYKGYSLQKAARKVIQEKLKTLKGRGGLVAVDHKGKVCFEFNTTGMFRGWVNESGVFETAIFVDAP